MVIIATPSMLTAMILIVIFWAAIIFVLIGRNRHLPHKPSTFPAPSVEKARVNQRGVRRNVPSRPTHPSRFPARA